MTRALLALAAAVLSIAAPAAAQVSPLYDPGMTDMVQYAAPTTGQTVAMGVATQTLILDPAGLLLALTVTLPPSPIDGARIIICSGGAITVLTINGGTVKGLITTLAINGYARFVYSATANAWFRTG